MLLKFREGADFVSRFVRWGVLIDIGVAVRGRNVSSIRIFSLHCSIAMTLVIAVRRSDHRFISLSYT